MLADDRERIAREHAAAKQKDDEKTALIAALIALAGRLQPEPPLSRWQLSQDRQGGQWRERPVHTYRNILYFALNGLDTKNPITRLHNDHRRLGAAIADVQNDERLTNLPPKLIDDLLIVGGYKPEPLSISSSLSLGKSAHTLLPAPMSNSTKLGIGLGATSLLALTGITLAATLSAKATAVATTTIALAATASTAFPPLLIGLIAAGVAVGLFFAAAVIIGVIKHYRDQQRMALGAAMFFGGATGSPAAALYAYNRMGGRG